MSDYKCPKCGGSDYFMSTRNVMKGIGGIWGNRGGLKAFPVCRVCDEIMTGGPKGLRRKFSISKRTKILFAAYLASILINSLIAGLGQTTLYMVGYLGSVACLIGGFISLIMDRRV